MFRYTSFAKLIKKKDIAYKKVVRDFPDDQKNHQKQ